MEFSPSNQVVRYCIQGMAMEEQGKSGEALKIFMTGWAEATDDFEKFLAAHFVARCQEKVSDRLKWFETALQHALKINDVTVRSAFPSLYLNIANCYDALHDTKRSIKYVELANLYQANPSDKGPFYHGTKADLKVGDLLTAGGISNYKSELKMNHIYFTAIKIGAGLAAELAKGIGEPRVYIVAPEGSFENDPNVTDKKFPGNPTRSYRSKSPLKIIGETTDWVRLTPEELHGWKERLANINGAIIN